VRETLRRAAVKLERVHLLERHRMVVYTRARDPRGERLIFRDGAFWKRADPTRAHRVRRNVVWLSPFGHQIVARYRSQLEWGDPIRWDAQTVLAARDRAARYLNRDMRHDDRTAREEDERDQVILASHAKRALQPAVPDEVETSGETERWTLAVTVARLAAPDASADDLWDQALLLWRTTSLEELERTVADIPQAKPSAGEVFRRRRRSPLDR
jgi:hypothetical protein